MTATDPRARRLAEAVHSLAREKATTLPTWPDLPLSEREKATAEARLWLRGAVDAGLVPAAAPPPSATDRATAEERVARWETAALEAGREVDRGALRAYMAVADDEQAELRKRHHDGLRRADEINNQLMEEVQRYAAGTERPVLWSVYNEMHKRAITAEHRAAAMEHAMQSTATAALQHSGCHSKLMTQCQRAEKAEAERDQLRAAPALLRRVADLVTERASDLWAPGTVAHSEMLADAEELRRLAAEAPAPETQTAPTPCDSMVPCEDGDPCHVHERLMAHDEGEHALCGPECTEVEPTPEDVVREHVTTLHLIGEQLTGIESWMWEHLAHVRNQPAAAADETAGEATIAELAHALDNSTPYPVELDRALCTFMAERLLEMLTVSKRPTHAVWQPEEPPGPCPEPMDPETLSARLRCPQCGEDITDCAEDDHVFRAGDDRPYCSGECVVSVQPGEEA